MKIELEQVVTIIGKSNVGKSSILRALRWLCLNRPGGEAFIREGSGHCKIRVNLEDRSVTRSRSGTRNAYSLDGTPLLSFGSEVPADVASLLNVSELNFQNQHDGAFWFSKTPGEVSRELNRIVDLESIDTTLAHLNKQLRLASTHTELLAERVKAAQQSRKDTLIVKRMNKDLLEVERLEERQNAALRRLAEASDLVEKGSRYGVERDRAAKRTDGALQALSKGEAWLESVRERDQVKQLFEKGRALEVWAGFKPPSLGEVEKAAGVLRGKQEKLNELATLMWDVMAKTEAADITSKRDRLSQEEFRKAMGDTCKLCGQKIPAQKS